MSEITISGKRWKHLDKPAFGMMNQISELVRFVEGTNVDRVPDLQGGSTIVIGSDYSGEHSTSDYEVLSLVLTDIENAGLWAIARRHVRESFLKDNRRFAFKNLNDQTLFRALPSFLYAADLMPGLLVTVLTHKEISSLFKLAGRIESSDPEIAAFPGWKPQVMERLLRVVHFISLFLSGLSRASQDVLWVTDEDAIAPNESKHRQLVEILGRVCSHYLAHTLGHIRVATTASDIGKRDVEDLVALPDLAAGALADVITRYSRTGTLVGAGLVVPIPDGCRPKTLHIMDWLSNSTGFLKKLCFAIDPIRNSTALSIRLLHFHGSRVRS